MPEADLVQVALEDLLLGVVLLHLARRGLLSKLPQRALVATVDQVGVHVPDKLLRDRARTPRISTHRVLERARAPDNIDAVVLIKAPVLDRDEGLTDGVDVVGIAGALKDAVRGDPRG